MPDVATSSSVTNGGHPLSPSQSLVTVNGNPVILLHDTDSAGCTVVEGSSTVTIDGIPVAYKGCAVSPAPEQICSVVATGDSTFNVDP